MYPVENIWIWVVSLVRPCTDNEFALNYVRMVLLNPIGIKTGLKH